MKSPLDFGPWHVLNEVGSTQDVASSMLAAGTPVGVVFALNQTRGRGRFQRGWVSSVGQSLTMSLAFSAYADHPRPYLIGMTVALAAAEALHAQVQWPNDLVVRGLKLGGVLTEIFPDARGRRVPVVGLGLNLGQTDFPAAISSRATSLLLSQGISMDAERAARTILERLANMPEPKAWADLKPVWDVFDTTQGKTYELPDGRIALALGVGPDGQLMCSIDGESATVLAADATFGTRAP